ncbi:MAG: hypothetical protein Kow0088_03780 [Anaerolineales bacterium]
MGYKFIKLITVIALVFSLAIGITTQALAQGYAEGGNKPSVSLFDQCANDDGSGGDTDVCDWTNGAIQANNSTYFEGDVVPQRLVITGLSEGEHTLTLKWQTTKDGKHAYDYLMTWNATEDWITNLDSGIPGFSSWSVMTATIPTDPDVGSLKQQTGYMTLYNGTITGFSDYGLEGYYNGDSHRTLTITFTVGADNSTAFFVWGGHLASQLDWGTGNSASAIPGAPYHMIVDKIDGKKPGERDNQVMTSAIVVNGGLVIVKDAIPDWPRAFEFSIQPAIGNTSTFSLMDDGDDTTEPPSFIEFSNVEPGTYVITETIPAETSWLLVEVDCDASLVSDQTPIDFTAFSFDIEKQELNVTVGENQRVVCTFTNQGSGTAVELRGIHATSQQSAAGFGLLVVGLVASLTAVWFGRRRQ